MKHIRIPWDKYEASLLIETYEKIQKGEVSKNNGLQNLSDMLRLKALREGKQIDGYFRNCNGMSFMINCIATTFNPNKYSIHGSNLFTYMVNLYKNDINNFNEILSEAHILSSGSDKIKYVFHSKYGYGIVVNESSEILDINFNNVFGIKHIQTGHASIKEVTKEEYLHNIRRDDVSYFDDSENEFCEGIVIEEKVDCADYQKVLNKFFQEGFSYNNPLQKKKFIRLYAEEFKKEFHDLDDLYIQKITKAGFVCDNRVYPISIISESLKDEIREYIKYNLNNGSPVIYYNTLFESFRGSLSSIFDINMIKGYVSFVFKDEFDFGDKFVCLHGENVDLKQILIELFMRFNRPLSKDEIYQELHSISHDAIDALLNDKDFIVNYRGKSYFYKDVFNINNNELDKIALFIEEKINEQDQLTGGELYEYIQKHLPNIIENNPGVTDLGIRNSIKIHLGERFRFKGDVISSCDNKVDIKKLYENFCENHETFTFEELENFRDSIRQSYIDYEAVFSKMIRVNQNKFIRRDLIMFDAGIIDNAILSYCVGQFVFFTDIINFIDFPTIQYAWNNYILESYVYSSSNKFKLVHATFNKEMPVGCIVKSVSDINTFDDLIVKIIKEYKLFNREKAFDFLLKNNIILTRKIKNIDILIDQAKQEE